MPRGVWEKNCQIDVGSTAWAEWGAQGKGFERLLRGRRRVGIPGRGHDLSESLAVGRAGRGCGMWSSLQWLEYSILEAGNISECWSRLGLAGDSGRDSVGQWRC